MRYFIVAGEASGDLHGSKLITALKDIDPEAVIAFMGGSLMEQAAGCKPVAHYKEIAVMGFSEVLRRFSIIKRVGKKVQQAILSFKPQHVITIDSSGFNFKYVLPYVHRHLPQTRITYYILPKLWAWREHRVRTLQRYTHLNLVILPFEEEYFTKAGLTTHFVGNPSVESVSTFLASHRTQHALQLFEERFPKQLDLHKPIIALLAGSRSREIQDNLPLMLQTVAKHFPNYQVVIAGAPAQTLNTYQPYLQNLQLPVTVLFNATYHILSVAHLAVVTSGTATLETALIGTPQVVCYRMNGTRFINWAFRHFMKVPYFSLVNLITQNSLVTELLGARATCENLARALKDLESNTANIKEGYALLWQQLKGKKASQEAAKAIVSQSK